MSTPTKSELWDQVTKHIAAADAFFKFANSNSPNYLGLEDSVIQSLEGQHAGSIASYYSSWRAEMNARFAAFRTPLLTLLRELAKFGYSLSVDRKTDRQVLLEIADAMNTASETVKNRAMTYGSISAGGSNVGSATIYRCTKDVHNNDLEVAVSGTVRADIVRDKNTGAVQGNEVLVFRGNGNVRVDSIQYADSTNEVVENKTLLTSGNNSTLLKDGSFDQLETTSSLTKNDQPGGWKLSDYANFERDTTNFFRFKQGEGAKLNGGGTSLVAKSNTNDVWFAQYIGRSNSRFKADVPYFVAIRVMVDNVATDGTLTLRLGSQTVTLDLSPLSANVWTTLVIGLDNKGYFDVFKENWIDPDTNQDLGVRVRADVTSRTVAGKIYFDEMVMGEGIPFNGNYYFPVAGPNADGTSKDALVGDTYSWADSSANTGRIQTILSELLGFSFPHTGGTPTYADA